MTNGKSFNNFLFPPSRFPVPDSSSAILLIPHFTDAQLIVVGFRSSTQPTSQDIEIIDDFFGIDRVVLF